MDWLEQELRKSLNRKHPSPDFAESVGRRIADHQVDSPAPGRSFQGSWIWPQWRLAAAAVVLVAGAGAIGYRQHQGELARRQVMQAFRIAGGSLNHIQSHVREVRR